MSGTDVIMLVFFIICTLILVFLFTVVKLAILRYFDFYYGKKIWKQYSIFHAVLVILVLSAILLDYNGSRIIILSVLLPIFVVLVISEILFFYNKHFNLESKGRFIISIALSYVANLGVALVAFTFYLVILMVIGYIAQL